MATVTLDGAAIADWPAFHAQCRDAFGFPDFYGNNMDAWVDCLSYLRDDEGMTRFQLGPDELLQIEIANADALRRQAPDILPTLEDCVEMINERYEDYGEKPALALTLR
ncbi:Barstar (barnase inhibitor) [Noviherbaspirillum humi]|uniref:Barstar (Barnase inhibitor) n=1 Tax=Noviherbaspirillum humi TaxID=1688639 RepID=A0A239E556_9BURK|nr:barstar family protein [Noviherbaspirillum humi]SNS39767.1 Barstar (barnase inhibitor) [Noviherbaspirillum humi]